MSRQRPRSRTVATIALVVLTLAALGSLAMLRAAQQEASVPSAEAVAFHARFIGPGGDAFFDDGLRAESATALSAVFAAAREANFTYTVAYYEGFGSQDAGAYVEEIRGHRATPGSPDGWIYRVERNGTWIAPDRGAGVYPLHAGDLLVWAWTSAWKDP